MDRKTYTFDEAFKASLDYFTGDELAAKVWVNKYALKDAFGNIYEESPNDMAMIIKLPHSLIVLLSDWTGKRIRMVRLFVLTKNRYN